MKNRNLLLCFPTIALILSCEGSRLGRGIVYDNQTKIPLDNVMSVSYTHLDVYKRQSTHSSKTVK